MEKPPAPNFDVHDSRRAADCSRAFDQIARAIILDAIGAGWREGEAALALADATERYVMYIAAAAQPSLSAANSNLLSRREK